MLEQIFRSMQGNINHVRDHAWWAPPLLAFLLGLPGAIVAFYYWPTWIAFLGVVWAVINWAPLVEVGAGA